MTTPVVIRTEGSKDLGMGALYKSWALAEALASFELQTHVLIHPSPACEAKLFEWGLPYTCLTSGGDLDEEVRETTDLLRALGSTVLVTCVSVLPESYIPTIRSAGFRTVCVEDIPNPKVKCDVVVNCTVVEEWHACHRWDGTRYCLGPAYAIVRKAFLPFVQRSKSFSESSDHVVVTLGGSNPSGSLFRILSALERIGPKVRKTILVGPAFPFQERLGRMGDRLRGQNFHLLVDPSDVECLFFEADLAISIGGNTLYELACVGTPAVVLHEDPHEEVQARAFQRLGSVISLGDGMEVSEGTIAETVSALLVDPGRLRAMSERGRAIVDSLGADRIARIIAKVARA
ncbi:hypothetical protein MYX64_00705 [Nitrospinae bacterium AH_259_B05_G02_I21]|nr:hypothetical protein [Nitrospinae bacterium AH_259_B05_G02_I21]MDA2931659.1 hypothetical protein [Nitrospinae bacterium AH-259-F20]